tara:strand:+ start:5623 stop:6633 length:1011 start_codon:yes stop_codon:yes gene_type:complete
MNDNEATLKDVILTLLDYKNELKKRCILILSVIIVFILFGYGYSSLQGEKYIATLSFIVEENSEGSNLSSISGMASQFGFDLRGNSHSSFSQQNVIELLKSRKIISSTLNKDIIVSGKEASFLHHYLNLNDMIEDSSVVQFNDIYKDSITNVIWTQITDNRLNISFQNDDANILNLNFTSSNSTFAKYFVETLIDEMSDMYSTYQTEKTRFSLEVLQNRADSVFKELKDSETKLARVKDRNIRVINSSGRLEEIQYMREVKVLNTMYLELVKNTELVKMNLLDETPIIQIIDTPKLPLLSINRSTLFWCVVFAFLGLFLVSFFIILRKLVKDTLKE